MKTQCQGGLPLFQVLLAREVPEAPQIVLAITLLMAVCGHCVRACVRVLSTARQSVPAHFLTGFEVHFIGRKGTVYSIMELIEAGDSVDPSREITFVLLNGHAVPVELPFKH